MCVCLCMSMCCVLYMCLCVYACIVHMYVYVNDCFICVCVCLCMSVLCAVCTAEPITSPTGGSPRAPLGTAGLARAGASPGGLQGGCSGQAAVLFLLVVTAFSS